MIRLLPIALLVALGYTFPANLAAQDTTTAALRVRIIDAGDSRPLAGARVGLTDIGMYALTDPEGVASLTGIPPGAHQFEVSMFGYAPELATIRLGPGAFASGDVAMAFRPIAIDEIMVEGRARWSAQLQRSGFYERASDGIGVHLDRLAIREFNTVLLSEVLERIPQRMGWEGFVNPDPTLDDVDFAEELPTGCAPGIYVDGTPWNGFIDDLPLSWIEGMEFFTSPVQVPTRYLIGGAFCGLLLVWTG